MMEDLMTFALFAIGIPIALAACLLTFAWMFMLAVGVVHGEWLTMMPTIGYWASVKVSAFLMLTGLTGWSVTRSS